MTDQELARVALDKDGHPHLAAPLIEGPALRHHVRVGKEDQVEAEAWPPEEVTQVKLAQDIMVGIGATNGMPYWLWKALRTVSYYWCYYTHKRSHLVPALKFVDYGHWCPRCMRAVR